MSHSSSGRQGRPSKTNPLRATPVMGATSAVGAFLAFGVAPLTGAPGANADELDVMLDPIIDSLSNIDPSLGAEVSSWVQTLDASFTGDSAASVSSVLDPLAAASTFNMAQFVDQWIYTPMHTGMEAWINSSFGESVDNAINQFAGVYLIGNGTAGTATDPNGGDGGLWFGDGGAGYDASADPGVAGGDGGAAGLFGNGGAGGDAGVSVTTIGPAAGHGGTGGTIMGNGGDGGAGGEAAHAGAARAGAGGAGGDAAGWLFGNGGAGGAGGNGVAGADGTFANGGNGAGVFGSAAGVGGAGGRSGFFIGDGGTGGNGGDGGNGGNGATGVSDGIAAHLNGGTGALAGNAGNGGAGGAAGSNFFNTFNHA
ncbi:PGRS repeat-containing protein, partial [Mycolicibacter icosiumassiliensis]|uniref:PGRS repeat-containing protein n=1 Tax=Mycolicibacter icosiumassiliensis TaxID=1792835 RepID=UPI000B2E21A6